MSPHKQYTLPITYSTSRTSYPSSFNALWPTLVVPHEVSIVCGGAWNTFDHASSQHHIACTPIMKIRWPCGDMKCPLKTYMQQNNGKKFIMRQRQIVSLIWFPENITFGLNLEALSAWKPSSLVGWHQLEFRLCMDFAPTQSFHPSWIWVILWSGRLDMSTIGWTPSTLCQSIFLKLMLWLLVDAIGGFEGPLNSHHQNLDHFCLFIIEVLIISSWIA